MIHAKTCYNCGGNLKFDRDKKILVCPFCGKTQSLNDSGEPATLEGAIRAMKAEQYLKARNMLTELSRNEGSDPDCPHDPKIILLLMLCGYRATSLADVLSENRKNASALQNLMKRSEWATLAENLPEDRKDLITDVLEFCTLSIKIEGKNSVIAGAQQTIRSETKRLKSAFARMDEEEKKINDRLNELNMAKTITLYGESDPDIFEFLQSGPAEDYDLTFDTAFRLLSLANSDTFKEYHDRIEARNAYLESKQAPTLPKKYNVLKGEYGKKLKEAAERLANEEKKSKEDLLARQDELIAEIRKMEADL